MKIFKYLSFTSKNKQKKEIQKMFIFLRLQNSKMVFDLDKGKIAGLKNETTFSDVLQQVKKQHFKGKF